MDVDLHNKVINEIAERGKGITRFLRYTGDGEPLIHPKLSALIGYAKSKTQLPINLTTNGIFLNLKFARELIEAGVNVFDVSIDAATEYTYDRIRVGGNFSLVLKNTLDLVQEFGDNKEISIVVSFVKQPLNESEVNEFHRFWSSKGIRKVIIRNGHSAAGSINSKANELWKLAPKYRSACLYPWERLVVKADGEITYCPADWHHVAGVGNVEFQSLQDTWNSPKLVELRRQHVTNSVIKDSLCGKCPDWSVIKWPHEADTYASLMHEIEGEL